MALRHPKCSKTFVKPEGVLDLWVALRLQLHYVTHYFWFILYWLSDATHPGLSPVGQCWLHLCWHRRTKEPQRAREKTNSQILSRFCEHLDGFGLDHAFLVSKDIEFPKLRSRWCSPRPNLGAGGGHVSPLRACTKWGHAGHAGRDVDAGAQLGVGLSSIRFQDLIIWIYMDHTNMEIIWKAMGMTWPKKRKTGRGWGASAVALLCSCFGWWSAAGGVEPWSALPGHPSQSKRFLGSAIPLRNHEDPPSQTYGIYMNIWNHLNI